MRMLPLLDAAALVGCAGAIDEAVHLEWSFPYCANMFDGPAYAFFGFPFPYIQFGGASSLESSSTRSSPWPISR